MRYHALLGIFADESPKQILKSTQTDPRMTRMGSLDGRARRSPHLHIR